MTKLAVDIVLLPPDEIINLTVEFNRTLIKKFGRKIVLDKKHCLPHISLAMGCLDLGMLETARKILDRIAKETGKLDLTIDGIHIESRMDGNTNCLLRIEKTLRIQTLHERVMSELQSHFTYDADEAMFFSPEEIGSSTIQYVNTFREISGGKNFFPHITIGLGKLEPLKTPIHFTASTLALCHLGNHCTCRKIIASFPLT